MIIGGYYCLGKFISMGCFAGVAGLSGGGGRQAARCFAGQLLLFRYHLRLVSLGLDSALAWAAELGEKPVKCRHYTRVSYTTFLVSFSVL